MTICIAFAYSGIAPLFAEDQASMEKQGMMTSPWSMWRPIPSSLLGGAPYPPTDRSLYTLYGGLFGLNNSNFVFPALGLHPLMAANNINNMRLREGVPATSGYNSESASGTPLHYPTALYRYHPYLNAEKLSAQKSTPTSSESSPTIDSARP